MISQEYLKNTNNNLQVIRDLYDKIFPCSKDYIKFLREEINNLDSKNFNQNSLKISKEIDEFKFDGFLDLNQVLRSNEDYLIKKDYWLGLRQEQIILFKKLIKKWLKRKTSRQRRIWNYFVLGVPKNSIAPKLKEDSDFVVETISVLQKEFLKLIMKN